MISVCGEPLDQALIDAGHIDKVARGRYVPLQPSEVSGPSESQVSDSAQSDRKVVPLWPKGSGGDEANR